MGSRPDNEYDVFFVDFGDQEWVTGDKIAPAWSSILQLPLQAVECSLVDVQPFGKLLFFICSRINMGFKMVVKHRTLGQKLCLHWDIRLSCLGL